MSTAFAANMAVVRLVTVLLVALIPLLVSVSVPARVQRARGRESDRGRPGHRERRGERTRERVISRHIQGAVCIVNLHGQLAAGGEDFGIRKGQIERGSGRTNAEGCQCGMGSTGDRWRRAQHNCACPGRAITQVGCGGLRSGRSPVCADRRQEAMGDRRKGLDAAERGRGRVR
jgi:hypothetical protein